MHAARPSLLLLKGKRGGHWAGGGTPCCVCSGKSLTRTRHFCQNRKKLLTRLRHKDRRDKHTRSLSHTHTHTRPLHPLTCPKNSSAESITLFSHYHVSLGHLIIKARVWAAPRGPSLSLCHTYTNTYATNAPSKSCFVWCVCVLPLAAGVRGERSDTT